MRVRVSMAALVLLAAAMALEPSVGAVAQARSAEPTSSFAVSGRLNDVASLAPRSAWAVGATGVCQLRTLIARWNGSAWEKVPIPAGARQGELYGVAVTSARNAWAVGYTASEFGPARSLLLHWDGTAWTRSAHPGAAGGVTLIGVAAISARRAWAVGYTGRNKIFIMRLVGQAWQRVHIPSPKGEAFLTGVAATSARNVWAVGTGFGLHSTTGLIFHWNGTAWTRVPAPALPPGSFLGRVAAISARTAWAVGVTGKNKTLILRWSGTAWRRVTGPGVTGGLFDVTVVSAHDAWAVGATVSTFAIGCAGSSARAGIPGTLERLEGTIGGRAATKVKPVILHWNGATWKPVTIPALRDSAVLSGVVATSAGDALAVGGLNYLQPNGRVLVLRWNGSTWRLAGHDRSASRPAGRAE